jgi:hypothetical protein
VPFQPRLTVISSAPPACRRAADHPGNKWSYARAEQWLSSTVEHAMLAPSVRTVD